MTEPDSTVSELSIMLLLYSEWLDVTGVMRTPRQTGDRRSHAELVADFLKRGAAERLARHQ